MAAIAEQVDDALKSLEAQLKERAEAERTPWNAAAKEAPKSGDSDKVFLSRHEETEVSLIRPGDSVLDSISDRSKIASLDGESSFHNSRLPSSVVSPVSTSFSTTTTESRRSNGSEFHSDQKSAAKPLKSIIKIGRAKNRTDPSESGRFDFSFGVPGKNHARIPVHLVVEYDQEGLQRIYANGREAHFV
ncbi:hypothetical protein L596_019535 [Steinernema carpocapsae]|nr:hypothetical protein L596_019535 [Steinernema carpocapsae]